ncbi:unnamed protein product [Camellia sinensis]
MPQLSALTHKINPELVSELFNLQVSTNLGFNLQPNLQNPPRISTFFIIILVVETGSQARSLPNRLLPLLWRFLAYVLKQIAEGDLKCPLESDFIKLVFTFDKLQTSNFYFFKISLTNPNLLTPFFDNCVPNLEISMNVPSEMHNIASKSNRRDYLSGGKTNLPLIYFFFFLIYTSMAGIWTYTLYTKRLSADRIHFFMLSVLILKALNLLCETEESDEFVEMRNAEKLSGLGVNDGDLVMIVSHASSFRAVLSVLLATLAGFGGTMSGTVILLETLKLRRRWQAWLNQQPSSEEVYYVYHFMLLVFLILIIVTACVTIVGTYFFLNAENYHWQWPSFFSAASTAVYVHLYSIYYYYVKTKMSGFFQTSFYFGYIKTI